MTEAMEPWTIPRFQRKFEQASSLKDQGKLEAAIATIDEILLHYPNDRKSQVFKGSMLYLDRRFREAADCFSVALLASPYHEKTSIGLFLSLAFDQRFYEAVREMERFLEAKDSRNYLQVCRDYPEQFSRAFEFLDVDLHPRVRAYLNLDAMTVLPPDKDWLDPDADSFLPASKFGGWGSPEPETKRRIDN